MKIIVLTLLLATASSFSILGYSFNANSTSLYAPPSYNLGALTNGSILTVTIQPQDNSVSGYAVKVMNQNNSQIIQTLTLGQGISASWNVTANASYNLQISGASPTTSVRMYYLVATINYTTTLLRLSDVLRSNLVRYIYIDVSDPASASVTVSAASGASIAVYRMGVNQFSVVGTVATTASSANGITTFALSGLTSGYYVIVFSVPESNSISVTFPTSTYPCPYSTGFSDYYGCFYGCTAATPSQPGPPCTNYDYASFKCLGCLAGYSLSNGVCLLPIPCNSRQYYRFGVCYPVNSSCDSFDQYTGDCLSCVNPNQARLSNGQCVPVSTLSCNNGTYAYGDICISTTCAAAFPNATCTACISIAFYLSAGACLPINCGANSYFSVKYNACAAVPVGCANFSVLAQNCQTCWGGYFLNAGACLQPYGSANCLIWNFNTNLCDQCQPNYSYILNICQINTIAPISCPGNQFLVGMTCINLPPNCLALNSFYICTQCALNYQISSGQCVACNGLNPNFPCLSCPANYFITAVGACQAASPYCKSSNQLNGWCTSCISGGDPVYGVCCPDNQRVQNGVCVGQSSGSGSGGSASGSGSTLGGKDLSYFAKCLSYNPESRSCVQCRNPYTFDYADHCN